MKRHTPGTRIESTLPFFLAASLALGSGFVGCGIEPDDSDLAASRSSTVQGRQAPPPPATTAVSRQPEPAVALVDTPAVQRPSTDVAAPVLFDEAEAAFHGKRFAQAVDLFQAYVEQRPANPWGFYMLGLSSWKAGDLEAAGTAFETALQLDPKHFKSLLNWSRVLLDQGRPDEALAHVEAALELDPASNDAYRLLARVRDTRGETDAAIEAYKQALVLDETDAWSMNNLAFLWIRQGQEALAVPALARAVELRADVAVFHNNLGVALERTGHRLAAAKAYRDALAADASYVKASTSLARVEALHELSEEALSLSDLAQGFAAEVQGWRQSTSSQTTAPANDDVTPAILQEETAEIVGAAVTGGPEPQP